MIALICMILFSSSHVIAQTNGLSPRGLKNDGRVLSAIHCYSCSNVCPSRSGAATSSWRKIEHGRWICPSCISAMELPTRSKSNTDQTTSPNLKPETRQKERKHSTNRFADSLSTIALASASLAIEEFLEFTQSESVPVLISGVHNAGVAAGLLDIVCQLDSVFCVGDLDMLRKGLNVLVSRDIPRVASNPDALHDRDIGAPLITLLAILQMKISKMKGL